MKRIGFALLTLLFGVFSFAQELPNGSDYPTLLQKPLRDNGIKPSDIQLKPTWLEFSASTELKPFHKLLIESPLEGPVIHQKLSNFFVLYPPDYFSGHLTTLSILSNYRIDFDPITTWKSESPSLEEFDVLFSTLEKHLGKKFLLSQVEDWNQIYSELSMDGRILLYELLQSVSRAWPWLQVARESVPKDFELSEIEEVYYLNEESPIDVKFFKEFDEEYDQRALYLASAEMGHFLTLFLSNLSETKKKFFNDIHLETVLGPIMVSSGSAENRYEFETPPLFLFDMAGNDSYQSGYSIATATSPFSITIDLEGEDRYSSDSEMTGSGSANFGFSAIVDLGKGSDQFVGKSRCFGYSFAGCSIVYDASGTSTYEIESHGLASSKWGISMLIDSEGSDTYYSLHKSQGCGTMNGVGLLLDLEGNDHYIAAGTPVVVPSAQLPEQNFSASQGYGSGRFGPYTDGYSFGGGIGILVDCEGNDHYQASVFAQGAGYGFGIGLLSDLNGNDRYENSWYALGSAAHQACGLAYDATGNDTVASSHYMIGGTANDLSFGLFVDEYGDDVYRACNASYGYSLNNSMGVTIERDGNDTYTIENGLGLGVAHNDKKHSLRTLWPTFGLFFDLNGDDGYTIVSPKQYDSRGNEKLSLDIVSEQNEYSLGLDVNN